MTRITISLDDREKAGLLLLAEKEFRDPRLQAALIIRRELERYGLVEVVTLPASPVAVVTVGGEDQLIGKVSPVEHPPSGGA